MNWLIQILSLPTENSTARMRAWRALKASGAAVLRDGVYLLPHNPACRSTLDVIASEVRNGGGTALVLAVEEPADAGFANLFDRTADYAALLAEVSQARAELTAPTGQDTVRLVRRLRKAFAALVGIDFFPAEAQRQTEAALRELELALAQALSPGEPQALEGVIAPRQVAAYQGRVWATRQRPWIDRLASAWLIRRFIDRKARFLWLQEVADCPADAVGFDFDGATFSHVDVRVTFEVLLASFCLEQGALARIGQVVHYLDVGGIQPAEAVGVETVLGGLREVIADDDQLLNRASDVLDGLLAAFEKGTP